MIYKVEKVLRTSPFAEYRDGLELLQANVGVTHYYYTISKILDIVNMRTSYYARGKYDSNGKPILEQIALTEDDVYILKSFLSEASLLVYDELQKLTHGLKDTYHFFYEFAMAVEDKDEPYKYNMVAKDKFNIIMIPNSSPLYAFAVTDDAWYNIQTHESHGVEIVRADDFSSATVRYTIWKKNYFSDSDEHALDDAILETFVRYVIWKWMSFYLPDASQFEIEYNNQFTALCNRINAQDKPIERSYHLF